MGPKRICSIAETVTREKSVDACWSPRVWGVEQAKRMIDYSIVLCNAVKPCNDLPVVTVTIAFR